MICSYFLIVHMFWIFVRIASKVYVSVKYQIQYSCIICDKFLSLKQRFRDSQIVIITNFVVVSSVGIKRVVRTSTKRVRPVPKLVYCGL